MKFIDFHCDTIYKIATEGGSLKENSYSIDSKKIEKMQEKEKDFFLKSWPYPLIVDVTPLTRFSPVPTYPSNDTVPLNVPESVWEFPVSEIHTTT